MTPNYKVRQITTVDTITCADNINIHRRAITSAVLEKYVSMCIFIGCHPDVAMRMRHRGNKRDNKNSWRLVIPDFLSARVVNEKNSWRGLHIISA